MKTENRTTMPPHEDEQAQPAESRRPYVKPTLDRHGKLVIVTAFGSIPGGWP